MQDSNFDEDLKQYEKLRRFPRYPIDVAVKVVRENQQGSSTCCYGRGTEIGEGGMAMYIAHEFNIGDAVFVQLTLPYTSQPIQSDAFIRNRHNYCYGIEFTGLDKRDRDFLKLMCRGLSLV